MNKTARIVWNKFLGLKTISIPIKWGIVAVEKNQLKRPGPASPEKKRLRKITQAARRRNRG